MYSRADRLPQLKPGDAPSGCLKYGVFELTDGCDRDDITIARISHGNELLHFEMQEPHHEATDRHSVSDNQIPLRAPALGAAHHALQKRGSSVITIGCTFTTGVPVVKPAMNLAQRKLVPFLYVAALCLSESWILKDIYSAR